MYWFEFESKMVSATNVVLIDYRIRDVVFLISLTHKVFQHKRKQVSYSFCLLVVNMLLV